jgi:hypothetical protein
MLIPQDFLDTLAATRARRMQLILAQHPRGERFH